MARIAKSLGMLRRQVNDRWPGRDKSSDGWIGDAAHKASKSDHNPNAADVVQALDLTHDPAHGPDARALAEALIASRDPRIKYIISNAEIVSAKMRPWRWRPYSGVNAHRYHVHISVDDDPALYDDARPWMLEDYAVAPKPKRFTGITATWFGGHGEHEKSAYDGHVIGDDELGVALPYRFKGACPKVRVWKGKKSVICKIVDVGPWNIDDPYWETDARPQAETGIDRKGRKTNKAGIDLTPAAARAIGLSGKDTVDWEFVDDGALTS
jgi:hypothetical protein